MQGREVRKARAQEGKKLRAGISIAEARIEIELMLNSAQQAGRALYKATQERNGNKPWKKEMVIYYSCYTQQRRRQAWVIELIRLLALNTGSFVMPTLEQLLELDSKKRVSGSKRLEDN